MYFPCIMCKKLPYRSAKFIENYGGNINKISVFGQDSNPTTWKMAQMNLAIRGIEADLGKFNADTFFNDCHPQLKAEILSGKWIQTHDCEHEPNPHEIRHLAAIA